MVQLISEGRWMVRQGIAIPDSVQAILQQENRFKAYKDRLELALSQFYGVVRRIPLTVRALFQTHIDQALVSFQPGVSTLAWNSMNIGEHHSHLQANPQPLPSQPPNPAQPNLNHPPTPTQPAPNPSSGL